MTTKKNIITFFFLWNVHFVFFCAQDKKRTKPKHGHFFYIPISASEKFGKIVNFNLIFFIQCIFYFLISFFFSSELFFFFIIFFFFHSFLLLAVCCIYITITYICFDLIFAIFSGRSIYKFLI